MRQWFFEAIESFEPEVGFETRVDVRHEGKLYVHLWKVTEVVPGRKITCEWKYPDYPGLALVTFELAPAEAFTRFKVTHSGLETFPQDDPDFSPQSCFQKLHGVLCRISMRLEDNLSDLRPRNHLYVSSRATTLPVNFLCDTTQLPDGFHDLTAVAYEGTSVRTQTRVSRTVQVQNTSLSAGFTLLLTGTFLSRFIRRSSGNFRAVAPMRAERAKAESRRDGRIIAQGKRSAALGKAPKTNASLFPSLVFPRL